MGISFNNIKLTGQVTGKTITTNDPKWPYVSLLLNGEGATNGANNNTFVDSSPNGYLITPNGYPAQGSFSPYGNLWGNNMAGGYLTVADNNCNFVTTGADFTIEAFVYLNSFSSTGVDNAIASVWTQAGIGQGDQWIFSISGSSLIFAWEPYSDVTNFLTGGTLSVQTWHHVAVTRSGSTFRLFLDGVVVTTGTSSGTTTGSGYPVQIGWYGSSNNSYAVPINGYLSNVRIVSGTALYTGPFSVPTSPLAAITGTEILTCQANRFADNSSHNYAITLSGTPLVQRFSPFEPTTPYATSTIGGSVYLNGANYLTSGTNTNAIPGTGDFTIEAWVYTTVSLTSAHIIGYDNYGVSSDWILQILNNTPSLYVNTTSTAYSGPALVLGQWNHIAAVRQSGVLTVYTNGIGGTPSTVTASLNYGSGTIMSIGASSNGAHEQFTGYISDARVVNGTALYTANFATPTSTLTAVTNTQFLENFTNAGIVDVSEHHNLIGYGAVQINTTTVKYGTGSIRFNGTTDYLWDTYKESLLGDWTIEGWFYCAASGVQQTLIFFNGGGSSTSGINIWQSTANQLVIDNGAVGQAAFTGGTIPINQWAHIALVRSGTTTSGYINGTFVGSNTFTPSTGIVAIMIGKYNNVSNFYFNGYIDDLRITNGVARYTANFVPPTQLPTY